MGSGTLLLVLIVVVPGSFGFWVVGYAVNLVSLATIPLLWLAALTVGVRRRDPVLFVVGGGLLPITGLVALAASLAEPPTSIDPAELPLLLMYYLAGPTSAVVIGTLLVRSPHERPIPAPTAPEPPVSGWWSTTPSPPVPPPSPAGPASPQAPVSTPGPSPPPNQRGDVKPNETTTAR